MSLLGLPSIYLPITLTSILALCLCVFALHRGVLIECFPTLTWLTLMQIPFILTSGGIAPAFGHVHMAGVGLFSLALFIGDACAIRQRGKWPPISHTSTKINWSKSCTRTIVAFGFLVIAIPVYHLFHAQSVPLLMLISDSDSAQSIMESREAFAKLLEVPLFMKYAFNWVMTVFGPVFAILLLLSKRPVLMLFSIVWLVIYALLSTAKSPIIFFILVTFTGTVPLWKPQIVTIARYFVFAIFMMMAASGIYRSNQLIKIFNESLQFQSEYITIKNGRLAEYPERGFGLSDIDRFRKTHAESPSVNTVYNYLVYRVILTPIEVSYHWYTFFPTHSNGWRPVEEIIGKRAENTSHAANRVGLWAYRSFFPDKYSTTVSAYASADADAYAFRGLFAVTVAACIILLMRLLVIPVMRRGIVGRSCGMMMLVFLGFFPSSASLQAILIAQGYFFMILISYFITSAIFFGLRRQSITN